MQAVKYGISVQLTPFASPEKVNQLRFIECFAFLDYNMSPPKVKISQPKPEK